MSDREYWNALIQVWVDTENCEECWPLWRTLVGREGRRPGSDAMMTEKEQTALAAMPDKITVYRGHQGPRGKIKDFSWTTNLATARWFAHRFDRPGCVLVGTVDKADVIAYTNRRNEHEVMAFPEDVRGVKRYKE